MPAQVLNIHALCCLMSCGAVSLQFGGVDLDPETSTLWFAGKQLQPDKKLAEHLGRNENTRAVVKLQKKGAGPPAREPVSTGARALHSLSNVVAAAAAATMADGAGRLHSAEVPARLYKLLHS